MCWGCRCDTVCACQTMLIGHEQGIVCDQLRQRIENACHREAKNDRLSTGIQRGGLRPVACLNGWQFQLIERAVRRSNPHTHRQARILKANRDTGCVEGGRQAGGEQTQRQSTGH